VIWTDGPLARAARCLRRHSYGYTHRKEYARWIEDAKREETRQRRLEKALEMLREGKTRG
jgi:uncharacterized protein YdeI (YjbR/CyaY-like superfamily)